MNDKEYMARVKAMERKLYRVASAILYSDADSADAIQAAVFKGWMKKAGLREPRYMETWLIRILINECRDMLRRRSVKILPLKEEILTCEDERMAEDLHLRQILQSMPEKYRLPLLLHHLEGYELAEIAKMLSVTPTLVKSRLHQARKLLRAKLEEGENI